MSGALSGAQRGGAAETSEAAGTRCSIPALPISGLSRVFAALAANGYGRERLWDGRFRRLALLGEPDAAVLQISRNFSRVPDIQ